MIGERIAHKRKVLNMTQTELAKKMHVNPKLIAKWESLKSLPEVSMLPLIADTLGLTMDELFKGMEKKPQPINSKLIKKDQIATLISSTFVLIGCILWIFGISALFYHKNAICMYIGILLFLTGVIIYFRLRNKIYDEFIHEYGFCKTVSRNLKITISIWFVLIYITTIMIAIILITSEYYTSDSQPILIMFGIYLLTMMVIHVTFLLKYSR